MTPESITVSLDMAKKLKEAGWEGSYTSAFFWAIHGDRSSVIPSSFLPMGATSDGEYIAAPTAEEILRRLPAFIKKDAKDFWLKVNPMCRYLEGSQQLGWQVWYVAEDHGTLHMEDEGYSTADLANAAAAMWCYLKEHNLLSSL